LIEYQLVISHVRRIGISEQTFSEYNTFWMNVMGLSLIPSSVKFVSRVHNLYDMHTHALTHRHKDWRKFPSVIVYKKIC
jgi:hypothetical protein